MGLDVHVDRQYQGPNDEGYASRENGTIKGGHWAKTPQGWPVRDFLSIVCSPSSWNLLTAHHWDSLWASWGFKKVRSSLFQAGIALMGLQLKAVSSPQYGIKMDDVLPTEVERLVPQSSDLACYQLPRHRHLLKQHFWLNCHLFETQQYFSKSCQQVKSVLVTLGEV